GAAFERAFPFLKRRYRGALCLGEARILMPERVAVELVEDAVAASPRSAALNYCALVGRQGDRLEIEDRVAGRRLGVTSGIVVNAAGAHADKVAALLGVETAMTGGVAGVHLVLDAPALAATLGDDLLFFEDDNADPVRRRLLVCYRLGGDRVLLGTTETPLDDPDAASVTAADEAYLAGALAAALPGTDTRGTIVGRLVGVRPLMRSAEANVTSRSRDHAVLVDEAHGLTMVTIIGGKWTTFRRMAEDAADAVLAKLERRRSVSTRDLPIGGGRDYPATASERQARIEALVGPRIDRDLAARLFDIYGTRAGRVAAYVAAFGAGPVRAGLALTAGEVAFFRAAELATSDEDCFRRRSDAALLG
ncbi:MAG: FAD-dependent oxidoreductase, partial [Rhizobiales bacterium]|nr:FAD-dependent oxidoreductase [Hyphomicrobiales bacterium]